MIVDIFQISPNGADMPKDDCYDCIGCPHLENIVLTSSHEVYVECDLD